MRSGLVWGTVVCVVLAALVASIAWASTPASTEWSHAAGVACTYDHDFPNIPSLNCGAVVTVECSGARLNGTVGYGYRHEGNVSGFLLRCHVHEADEVMCEPCCMVAGGCNPPDQSGSSIRDGRHRPRHREGPPQRGVGDGHHPMGAPIMIKSKLTLAATLAALGTGAGIAYFASPAPALAGFGGGTAFVSSVGMRRLAVNSVACAGECIIRSAEDDDSRPCPLRPGPQASYAACLTTLAGLCNSTCKTTP